MNSIRTEGPFNNSSLGSPSLAMKGNKFPSGSSSQKVKMTRKHVFNFNHHLSTTMNFNQFETFTPGHKSSVSFRLFNLSKSGFSSSVKGPILPKYVYTFVQK